MKSIFVSYATADREIATEVQRRLLAAGYPSVFIDYDAEHGIAAGTDWERALYSKLRDSLAVVAVVGATYGDSKWCFAEITQARALGKFILPIRIGAAALPTSLQSLQAIPLAADPEDAYRRLEAALTTTGLDPSAMFTWDPQRPPYPGLLAHDEGDAAVYFGRDADIRSTREALNRARLGGPRWITVLGASGSGKSSLVRAGVIPRLRREREAWLVVDPFRPGDAPLEALARALEAAFAKTGAPREWPVLRDAIQSDAAALVDQARDLRSAAGQREALVVLVVDQLEEALRASARDAKRFLEILCDVARRDAAPIVVIATLRSDFLAALQSEPAAQTARYESQLLGLMGAAELAQAVEGPAERSGLTLAPGLASGMVADAGSSDALPLLAFALRDLWESRADDSLTVALYEQRGKVDGAIARAAVGICAGLSPDEERALRRAFRALVRLNDDGRPARRVARWSELPEAAHAILEKFVERRLLVSRADPGEERVLEVAHEALFRAWSTLKAWIEEDRALLVWHEQLRDDCELWIASGRDEGSLLRGRRLLDAEAKRAEHDEELSAEERAFVQASIDARERERAAREQERKARERARRAQVAIVTTSLALLVGLAATVVWQWWQAESSDREATEQRRIALSRQITAEARGAFERDYRRGLVGALVAYRISPTREARSALIAALRGGRVTRAFDTARPIAAALSPNGTRLVAVVCEDVGILGGCNASKLQAWDAETAQRVGDEVVVPDSSEVTVAAFFDAESFATVSIHYGEPSGMTLWSITSGSPVPGERTDLGRTSRVAFSRDGARLAVLPALTDESDATRDRIVLWDVRTGRPMRSIALDPTMANDLDDMAFSPDGRALAVNTLSGSVVVLDLEHEATPPRTLAMGAIDYPEGIAWAPSGRFIARLGEVTLMVWALEDGDEPCRVEAAVVGDTDFGGRSDVTWASDDLVFVGRSGTISTWRFAECGLEAETPDVWPLALSAFEAGTDGTLIVSQPDDGTLFLRGSGDTWPAVTFPTGHVEQLVFTRSGERLAIVETDGVPDAEHTTLELWDADSSPAHRIDVARLDGGCDVNDLAFVDAESSLVVLCEGTSESAPAWDTITWDPETGGEPVRRTVRATTTAGIGLLLDAAPLVVARFEGSNEGPRSFLLTSLDGARSARIELAPHWMHAISRDGLQFASAEGGRVAIHDRQLWSTSRGEAREQSFPLSGTGPFDPRLQTLRFSDDGNHLAHVRMNGMTLWDLRTGRVALETAEASWIANQAPLQLSSTTQRLAVDSDDGPNVWDLRAATPLFSPGSLRPRPSAPVALSSDGTRFAAQTGEGEVTVWHLSADEPDVQACRILGRGVTPEEVARLAGDEPIDELCQDVPATR